MAGDEDYEHWKEDDKYSTVSNSRSGGYDGSNGLRKWDYLPTDNKQKPKTEPKVPKPPPVAQVSAPPPAAQQPPLPPQQQIYYMMGGYPQVQYAYPPQIPMAYPAPAYYGCPPPGYGYVAAPGAGWVCQPATAAPEDKKPERKKDKSPEIMKWQGRTKAEVEEDNMKIAKREGVCDARKVEPKGLTDDQMVWCVELDGSHTLRTFATVKDFYGDWKADPRFKDSWYFVRQEETSD